jgi:hypothetical protein
MAFGVQLTCCFDDEREDGEKRLVRLLVDYGRGSWQGW